MGLESATYISDLVSTNPAAGDAKSQGDDHIRLVKATVKATFPNVSGAVTATHAELNIMDGVTASTAELNILDGVTASTAELNIMDGVTATTAELNYTDGVTSNIQTQLDGKAALNSPTFTGTPAAPTASAGTSTTQIATTAFVAATAFSSALPAQTGNSGKFVTTNGSAASWAFVDTKGADIASASTINLDTATGNYVDVTGTTTITAITLAEGLERTVRFTGALTLTNGASLVLPGGANITTAAGDFAVFRGDASSVVRCVMYSKASGVPVVSQEIGDHEVYVTTGNGYGSTNTKIERFTTTQRSVGSSITYADSAANGASFTINDAGVYSIQYSAYQSSTDNAIGVSVNSAELTTSIASITAANRLCITAHNSGQSGYIFAAITARLALNDVIRPHVVGAGSDASTKTWFRIQKIGD